MKYLELEIYHLRIQILAAEMTQFYLKILTFGPVLTELVFRFIFQFNIFILKQSSKRCLISSKLLLCSF